MKLPPSSTPLLNSTAFTHAFSPTSVPLSHCPRPSNLTSTPPSHTPPSPSLYTQLPARSASVRFSNSNPFNNRCPIQYTPALQRTVSTVSHYPTHLYPDLASPSPTKSLPDAGHDNFTYSACAYQYQCFAVTSSCSRLPLNRRLNWLPPSSPDLTSCSNSPNVNLTSSLLPCLNDFIPHSISMIESVSPYRNASELQAADAYRMNQRLQELHKRMLSNFAASTAQINAAISSNLASDNDNQLSAVDRPPSNAQEIKTLTCNYPTTAAGEHGLIGEEACGGTRQLAGVSSHEKHKASEHSPASSMTKLNTDVSNKHETWLDKMNTTEAPIAIDKSGGSSEESMKEINLDSTEYPSAASSVTKSGGNSNEQLKNGRNIESRGHLSASGGGQLHELGLNEEGERSESNSSNCNYITAMSTSMDIGFDEPIFWESGFHVLKQAAGGHDQLHEAEDSVDYQVLPEQPFDDAELGNIEPTLQIWDFQ